MKILTFDIEEWFHILDNDATKTEAEWEGFESRLHSNMNKIHGILENQKATFFCLGWVARKYPEVLKEIRDIEARKDFSNPRYMELLIPNFYEKHILRFPAKDWPEPVNRSLGKTNQSLYVTMQGPSEFGISGKLEKWDRKADLKNVKIPTLVIGAKHDTMDPKHMEEISKILPNGSYLFCPKGSHMAFYDDQKTYFSGLISFLKK